MVTLILLIGALGLLAGRGRLTRVKGDESVLGGPEETIWRMSDAAREGNGRAYLECFSGTLQQNLQRSAAEMGEARFSEYLRQLHNEMALLFLISNKAVLRKQSYSSNSSIAAGMKRKSTTSN